VEEVEVVVGMVMEEVSEEVTAVLDVITEEPPGLGDRVV
jgi:hypothetical protein